MKQSHLLNRWLAALTFTVVLIVAIVISAGAFRSRPTSPSQGHEPDQETARFATTNEKEVSASAASSSDAELALQINQTIDTSNFTSARWGVCVISLRNGRVLYARNADKLFTPASNMKIYTTAIALDQLGASYRWRTSVYAKAPAGVDGVISGDLTLYGRGAPDLSSRPGKEAPASLVQLAESLYQRGVRHINGNVVGDESYFRGEPWGDGWQWNDIQWYFGAEPSALSIDDNEVDVEIKPSAAANQPPVARLSSEQPDLKLTSDIDLTKSGEPMTVGIHRGLSDNNFHVWGEFPAGSRSFGARLSIHDPARLAAGLFIAALQARGITVAGEIRTRDFRTAQSQRFNPSQANELTYVLSRPLDEIVRATNKESINLNAELILRTLGRERGDQAPDADPHRTHERGDDEAGLAVVRQWLDRKAITTKNLALHDGSGLSRLDLVTPETTARLLQATTQTATAAIFRASLPVAGTDGTLRGRLRSYKDRVWAKTGSLTYDNSLSGYLATADGTELAFSIMCNDQTSRAGSIQLIDKIVETLANYSPGKPPKAPKS
ncbi:MAG: D-alanyl-D-alanine carboxypeptidase/D-alanyl-D-alanine-endopeptidase [Acidobacteria bacterium]|nr:D-alanyl-D-alanine carboxypeptidase/D-alanyl-D-alanine-endopeptidase [Acidobacteriota bacterium]